MSVPLLRDLATLYRHRELLVLWTEREIKVRYKQSLLGIAWAILQPLALMAVSTVVFSLFVKIPSDGIPYPLFSYTALLGWTFFSTSATFAIPSLVNNMNLVTKVYFPREILPLASIGAAFVDLLVASCLLVPVLVWYQAPLSPALLWLPVILATQVLLTVGVVVPVSALNVFYRDVRFLVPLALQVWMYATPVVYPLSLVPDRFRTVYALNPMVGIVDSYRRVLLEGLAPVPEFLAISIAASFVLAVAGFAWFKSREALFADLI
jgi:homopolymeric O-antigen transport system permease protein